MIDQILRKIGLSDKEAAVYLALLEMGSASAYEISKIAQLNHATVYITLAHLKNKGLVSKFEEIHKTKFAAAEPKSLERFLAKERQNIEDKEQILKQNYTELSSLFLSAHKRPRVRVYLGKKGAAAIEEDADNLKEETGLTIYAFTPMDIIAELDYEKHALSKRVDRQKELKLIYTHKDGKQNYTNRALLREAKFLSRDKFPFDASVVIAPSHSVRLLSYKKEFVGIWIDSPEIANTLKVFFDIIWRFAEKEF